MAGAESIVNVSVSQAGQLFAEGVDILGFFLAETGVLEQNNIAVAHGGNSSLGLVANNVVVISKGNRLAQLFAQANSNGSQAELGFGAILRLAQMAAQDNLCAVSDQLFDGRQSRIDAVVVGDHTVLHRDIEIAADKHALASVVFVINRLFAQTHGKKLLSVIYISLVLWYCLAQGADSPFCPAYIIRRICGLRKGYLTHY